MDATTPEFTGIYGFRAFENLAFAFEEDVAPAPGSSFGIQPMAEETQLVGAAPALGVEQPGTSIIPSLVQQVAPSFDSTLMPGAVFAGPVMPIGGIQDEIGGVGGREDAPGGFGGIAGVGIGPLPWMTEEEFLKRPPPTPPIELGTAPSAFPTATTVRRVLDNITGTAEYAHRLKPPVAPDYSFLGYSRERRITARGLQVAPHAGYFYFGGIDFGPNGGIGSDGTPRLHDGYADQVRRLAPALEPEGMCGHAMSLGLFTEPRRDPLRIFQGEERGLALGAGPAIAPDSISDAPGGVPAVVEAEAPLSPMREELIASRAEAPESLSKGAMVALRSLLDGKASAATENGALGRGPGGAAASSSALVASGSTAQGGAALAGSAFAQSFGGTAPGTQLPGLAAAGSMSGVGGGGGGLVGQSAAARVDRWDALVANSEAQQRLDNAQKKADEKSAMLMAAQAEHRAVENKEAIEKAQSEVAAAKAEKDAAYSTADGERQNEARERFDAAESKLKEEKQKADPNSGTLKGEVDKADEEDTKAKNELSKAEKEAAKAQARYERTKEAVEALDAMAAKSEPSYGNYLKRVGEAVERYRKYKEDAERRQMEHDAKMSSGIGGLAPGEANKEKREAAIKAAREARELRQSARNGRDAATSASARLTQLRGHISPEAAKKVKDNIKAVKDAAKEADKAGKKAQDAIKYGPPSRVTDTEEENQKAKMNLMMALEALATALKEAEDEAKKKKMEEEGGSGDNGDEDGDEGAEGDGGDEDGEAEDEDEEEEEEKGPCADYNPDECVCPGDCEEEGKECLWCIWVPWPPPGVKGKGGSGAPPSPLGLMPPDTGVMSVMGFPFYAMMQEEPKPPAPKPEPKPEDTPAKEETPEEKAWRELGMQEKICKYFEFWVKYLGASPGEECCKRWMCLIRAVSYAESVHGTGTGNEPKRDPMQSGNPRDQANIHMSGRAPSDSNRGGRPFRKGALGGVNWSDVAKHVKDHQVDGAPQDVTNNKGEVVDVRQPVPDKDTVLVMSADGSTLTPTGHEDKRWNKNASFFWGILWLIYSTNQTSPYVLKKKAEGGYSAGSHNFGDCSWEMLIAGAVKYNGGGDPDYRTKIVNALKAIPGCEPK